jgi:membrane protease YdiL (CAAX protease family)
MNRRLFQYLTPVLLLLSCLTFLVLSSALKRLAVPEWASMFVFLLVFNLAVARFTGLVTELREAWNPKKISDLVAGFSLGALPVGAGVASSIFRGTASYVIAPFSISGTAVTLLIVSWEELWFRGITLNLAGTRYSKLGAAIVFGTLFMVLHLLNPAVHLLTEGFGLFLAGYTLSTCYFVFQSIWAPIGMHFANNIIESEFGLANAPPQIINLILLSVIAAVFTGILRVRDRVISEVRPHVSSGRI